MTTDILAAADCAACDRYAVENGVMSQSLMRKAGEAVATAIRTRWAPRPVLVLAGPGNNGGDGLIAAASLRESGWPVRVVLFAEPASLTDDAAWAFGVWGEAVERAHGVDIDKTGLVVDALFGAGLSRAISGDAARWIEQLQRARTPQRGRAVPVIAVDLPSGVAGDAHMSEGSVLTADLTVTFHARKLAHLIEPFAGLCGEVVCADIGIPDGWQQLVAPIAQEVVAPDWPAARSTGGGDHKHQRGRVAVFSGGASATGAARLAARAALRAGSGLVTVCSPPSAHLVNAGHLTAAMLTRWDGAADTARVLADLRAQSAVLGPAMGVGDGSRESVLSALSTGLPLVLDADALTSFADTPDILFDALHPACVLTPHQGEFDRLFAHRLRRGSKFDRAVGAAGLAGCTVLLKGPATVIASPGRVPFINRHASAWLATAGSGDVLAGMIASGLASGLSPHDAAAGAAWLHGAAGRRLGAGLIAEDLPEELPVVLQALRRRRQREAVHSHLLSHGS
ncbi:NAD(P)H-hydrate dehydratase [Maricaulis maris]|uniref:Bifunctional NAD(P)H-hydrate repair enzyme n=1 Tax=Maricaulis maris TaxID=74318 RepID=A0A495DMS1_9PROT|nr:NAD(P)H-hydrate dehydratase [Maricaulis maris]RKR03026.1 NAD(P)H-hydrate epimerase [Maricaulis maris]